MLGTDSRWPHHLLLPSIQLALLPSTAQLPLPRVHPHPQNASWFNRLPPVDALTLVSQLVKFVDVSQKLDLDLNPNINFILGDNGSGKSSILSAIQIALGSNGKSTGQGNAFKKFVRYNAK